MTVPLVGRIGALVLATTAFYAYVGQMVPQSEVHPPAEIALRADLTTADMVKVGREITEGKGLCLTCHTIGKTGALRFPDLEGIGSRAQSRVPGLSDIDYLAESMYEPEAFVVPGFNPGMPPVNKPPIGLTDQEILCVIAYLQTLGGTPTVTLQSTHRHLSGAPGVAPAPAAPKKGARLRPAGPSPAMVRNASAGEAAGLRGFAAAAGRIQPVVAHQAAARLVPGPRRAFFARRVEGGAACIAEACTGGGGATR